MITRTISIVLLAITVSSCSGYKNEKNNLNEIKKLQAEKDSLKNILIKNKREMKLEINMIVTDAIEAGDYYKKVLNAEVISQTDNEAGMNETIMKLGGVEIRILDENKDLGLIAPVEVGAVSIGINLFVNNIDVFFNNAIKEGGNTLSPIQEFPDIPAKNAVFSDKFNHIWVVNQQY